ncbi:polysaccharide pyruvyl transferase family protein [Aerococcus viridans]
MSETYVLKTKKSIVNFYRNLRFGPSYKKMSEDNLKQDYGSQRIIIFATPSYGNLGDHAITEAEVKFLRDNFPQRKLVEVTFKQYSYAKNKIINNITENDLIVIHGGGFLGTLWFEAELQTRDIIESFPNNKIFIMPQTIYFEDTKFGNDELKQTINVYNNHSDLTICLREKNSFEFVNEHFSSKVKTLLVPDIVMYLDETQYNMDERRNVLLCLRSDKEKISQNTGYLKVIQDYLDKEDIKYTHTDTVVNVEIEGLSRRKWLREKWDEFGQSSLVVTDRLHGMIFCLITGSPCIAFDNKSKKVSGVYEWIKDCGFIICITDENKSKLDNLEDLVNSLTTSAKSGYNRQNIEQKFNEISIAIEKNLKG